jgi:hypothetical protein
MHRNDIPENLGGFRVVWSKNSEVRYLWIGELVNFQTLPNKVKYIQNLREMVGLAGVLCY